MHRIRWILVAAVPCASSGFATTPATPAIGIDHGIQPGDNFFKYSNGDWLKTATIPADRFSIGGFLTIFEKSEKDTAESIRAADASHPASGSDARKIADYYAAWMDTATIEQHGLAPLKPVPAPEDRVKIW